MKRPIATAAAALPIAALLLAAGPARAELWTDDSLTRETAVCALARLDRKQASSRSCLGCHDGTTGSGVSYTLPGAAPLSGMHASHPIEMTYGVSQARRPRTLVPEGMLPAALVLPEGKVSCVTCHDGASGERHHTAVSMSKSALCSACHAL